uniref:HDC09414 n=1 Tax=Drosophila melanogaster TaxID=7227 RepID=Q6ILI0_DROME|nr:TPA_inf: HDC09414 [Drosophila melanogaster]
MPSECLGVRWEPYTNIILSENNQSPVFPNVLLGNRTWADPPDPVQGCKKWKGDERGEGQKEGGGQRKMSELRCSESARRPNDSERGIPVGYISFEENFAELWPFAVRGKLQKGLSLICG